MDGSKGEEDLTSDPAVPEIQLIQKFINSLPILIDII
jgi:hypothetical protein